jgi:hypothetical protein
MEKKKYGKKPKKSEKIISKSDFLPKIALGKILTQLIKHL